jgi:hypothetical protein
MTMTTATKATAFQIEPNSRGAYDFQRDGDQVVFFPRSHRAFLVMDLWSSGSEQNCYCYRPHVVELDWEAAEQKVAKAKSGTYERHQYEYDHPGWNVRYISNCPHWIQSGVKSAAFTAFDDLTAVEPAPQS